MPQKCSAAGKWQLCRLTNSLGENSRGKLRAIGWSLNWEPILARFCRAAAKNINIRDSYTRSKDPPMVHAYVHGCIIYTYTADAQCKSGTWPCARCKALICNQVVALVWHCSKYEGDSVVYHWSPPTLPSTTVAQRRILHGRKIRMADTPISLLCRPIPSLHLRIYFYYFLTHL